MTTSPVAPSPSVDISIVLPFFNEEGSVKELFHRLYPVLGKLGLSYEIICIDDGSSDGTYHALLNERERDLRIKPVRLARNFGKEAALTCGLRHVSGRAAITLDSDLQHPPEVIPDLIDAWNNGAKMVYAIRRNRNTDGLLRRLFSRAFYALFRHIADIKLPEGAGDYRLLDRAIVDAVNILPERNRFMKGLMTWAGYDYALVTFDVETRKGGASHWNFLRLFSFAFDGIAAFSSFPLRLSTWFGCLISLSALGYGLYLIAHTLISGIDVPGYASLMVTLLFLGGIQLLSIGIIGEYLGRIFTEVKGRPIYLVAEKKGFEDVPTSLPPSA